jgi:hypothetical protein
LNDFLCTSCGEEVDVASWLPNDEGPPLCLKCRNFQPLAYDAKLPPAFLKLIQGKTPLNIPQELCSEIYRKPSLFERIRSHFRSS